jgi:hypothetical protein
MKLKDFVAGLNDVTRKIIVRTSGGIWCRSAVTILQFILPLLHLHVST